MQGARRRQQTRPERGVGGWWTATVTANRRPYGSRRARPGCRYRALHRARPAVRRGWARGAQTPAVRLEGHPSRTAGGATSSRASGPERLGPGDDDREPLAGAGKRIGDRGRRPEAGPPGDPGRQSLRRSQVVRVSAPPPTFEAAARHHHPSGWRWGVARPRPGRRCASRAPDHEVGADDGHEAPWPVGARRQLGRAAVGHAEAHPAPGR